MSIFDKFNDLIDNAVKISKKTYEKTIEKSGKVIKLTNVKRRLRERYSKLGKVVWEKISKEKIGNVSTDDTTIKEIVSDINELKELEQEILKNSKDTSINKDSEDDDDIEDAEIVEDDEENLDEVIDAEIVEDEEKS
jgi:hypothetical protein